jgi:hypothetical protein
MVKHGVMPEIQQQVKYPLFNTLRESNFVQEKIFLQKEYLSKQEKRRRWCVELIILV